MGGAVATLGVARGKRDIDDWANVELTQLHAMTTTIVASCTNRITYIPILPFSRIVLNRPVQGATQRTAQLVRSSADQRSKAAWIRIDAAANSNATTYIRYRPCVPHDRTRSYNWHCRYSQIKSKRISDCLGGCSDCHQTLDLQFSNVWRP